MSTNSSRLKQNQPAFVIAPGMSYLVTLTQNEDSYMNGEDDIYYTPSISSYFNTSRSDATMDTVVAISFGTFDVNNAYQYPSFDYLTLIGTLGGCASLTLAMHSLVFTCCIKSSKEKNRSLSNSSLSKVEEPKTLIS